MEAFTYMFGEGGVMQGTLVDDIAKQSATATVIIQFDHAGGFNKTSSASPSTASGEKCPQCSGMIKTGVNRNNKPYKKCDSCRIWIGDFGRITPMVN